MFNVNIKNFNGNKLFNILMSDYVLSLKIYINSLESHNFHIHNNIT